MLSALIALAGRALCAPLPTIDDPPVDDNALDASAATGDEPPAPGDSDDDFARSPLDAGATLIDDAFVTTSGLVDATSLFDIEQRHHRPSRWGRIDLAIAWRSVERWDATALTTQPRQNELWLVAIWRH